MAPTGSGKTLIAMLMISGALGKAKRALFVCDRKTLINQSSAVADSYGLTEHGVIQADHWRANEAPFQICSSQTLANRGWPQADLIVLDECHAVYDVWSKHIPNIDAAVIGLSATPFAPGLGKLFSNLVNATTMHDLVESKVLAPLKIFSCTPTDMKGAATSGGEWTDRAAEERGLAIVGDVVSEWVKFGEGRKTIVFGATINHCEEIARQFNALRVVARVFTCETKDAERSEILAEYRQPDSKIRVLVSVEALAKGFDVPDVSCLVDCRPLRKSLSTAIQMWGRGMRSSPGKADCRLLSHSGNIDRFARDFEDIYHNGLAALDDGEKLDKKIRREEDEQPEAKGCPKCGFKPFFRHCVQCGHVRIAHSNLEIKPGEMREIRIGKTKLADDSRHLWEQVCTYARKHSAPDKQKWRAHFLFRDLAGTTPPLSWSINATPDVPITSAVANKIKSKNIAFIKSRRQHAH